MYAFDLATRYHGVDLTKIIFRDGTLNPEWIRRFDVLGSSGSLSWKTRTMDFKQLKVGESMAMGCFTVRRTPKAYVISTNLARLKA